MKRSNLYFSFIFLVFIFFASSDTLDAQERRPNIIVFLVDDMGWMDTSVPFGDSVMALNRIYRTPNMERLAREGMKFTNAYATPVCTPTRVSLLTGMNAAHHRVTNWTNVMKDRPSDAEDKQFNRTDWNYNGYSPVPNVPHTAYATALPQILKDAGYFTVHVGKAHWGAQGTPGANPLNLGFMVNVAGNAIGHPQSYYGKDNYGNIPGKFSYNAVQGLAEYYGSDTFLTEALTLEALKSIDQPAKSKQPFYLHLAHYAIHVPMQADVRFVQKYYDMGLDSAEAKYASLIEGMDKSLGDVMDYLEENGLEKNTIILFMSDNGGLSLTSFRGGEAHTQNLPLRAGKGSVYEGGIREPMIVKWPGVVKANTRNHQPLIIEDFFPSILEMAKISKPKLLQQVDGVSFVPLLKGAKFMHDNRSLIWHYPHKWTPQDGPGINYFSAIRRGKWKLVYDYRRETLELYNLSEDLGEQVNLVRQQTGIATQLAAELTDQLKKWGALMPTTKESNKAVAWPDVILKQMNSKLK
ncbi:MULTISPECIES: sulfatase [Sphingobacterium]|uniref:sulfatase n=1 Tax=Sphingobacterium TaxID=28453 RepID=UPI0013DA69B7|nr:MULTISPECIES: sulfatase [unclassified Sphingobacterium]